MIVDDCFNSRKNPMDTPASSVCCSGYGSIEVLIVSLSRHWGRDTWSLMFLEVSPGVWHLWLSLSSATGTTALHRGLCVTLELV